jgi:hypothetical protein
MRLRTAFAFIVNRHRSDIQKKLQTGVGKRLPWLSKSSVNTETNFLKHGQGEIPMIQKCLEFLFDLVVTHGAPSVFHLHVEGWVPVSLVLVLLKLWLRQGKRGGRR